MDELGDFELLLKTVKSKSRPRSYKEEKRIKRKNIQIYLLRLENYETKEKSIFEDEND